MQGRRIQLNEDGSLPKTQPGDYCKDGEGRWWAETPNGLLGNLASHEVTEHEDGTITVSPSILVNGGVYEGENWVKRDWHGYLERGVWREC